MDDKYHYLAQACGGQISLEGIERVQAAIDACPDAIDAKVLREYRSFISGMQMLFLGPVKAHG